MQLSTTHWFFEKLIHDNLCLLYSGHFSEEILRKVMDLSELKIEKADEYRKKKKRMLFLMAEGFQNIIKHGEKHQAKEVGINKNFFLTLNRENVIFISTGNLIENENIADLQKHLIEVNSLDQQGLKELHSYVMKHGNLSDRGGAGLGLISIARKSDRKLNYTFDAYKNDLSFYYNQIVLTSKEDLTEEQINTLLPIDESKVFHRKMMAENIQIIQKGDFSHESMIAVLEIVQNNLQAELNQSNEVQKSYNILHRLLDNIDKHGLVVNDKKEGIFLMARQNSHYIINTGNYIDENNVEGIKNRLDQLNKEKQENTLDSDKEQNIGFIEIAKASSQPLSYSFEKDKNNRTFFSLSVTI